MDELIEKLVGYSSSKNERRNNKMRILKAVREQIATLSVCSELGDELSPILVVSSTVNNKKYVIFVIVFVTSVYKIEYI